MAERKAKWQNDYIARTYDRINLTVPKGQKEIIQAHAEAQGESVNGFIGRAILEAMERDGGGTPSETLDTVQRDAETVPDFIRQATETKVERDNG